ncbi:PhzF family phenazine biosynthesis protein [Bacillus manliponensis]|uniref:PhzF family phenazine biosynthesis protein n=1 Tax=Bacillus manliponensis TaxID=574376 RepID=UPI0035134B55
MKVQVYVLSAFIAGNKGGNLAGVVYHDTTLSHHDMQYIANRLGFSETAFIYPSKAADYQIIFYTPTTVIDLCGHATIASFSLLQRLGHITSRNYTAETKGGLLHVEVQKNGKVFLQYNSPEFLGCLPSDEIAEALQIPKDFLVEELPLQVVSTGIPDLIVPIKTLKGLQCIQPDLERICNICNKYNIVGFHLFTEETETSAVAHCRNFAPLYGIPEESATGTSNASLMGYLMKYKPNILHNNSISMFEQGYIMQQPSNIFTKRIENDIFIGGNVLFIEEKMIELKYQKH